VIKQVEEQWFNWDFTEIGNRDFKICVWDSQNSIGIAGCSHLLVIVNSDNLRLEFKEFSIPVAAEPQANTSGARPTQMGEKMSGYR
jgi:hypothetical protein